MTDSLATLRKASGAAPNTAISGSREGGRKTHRERFKEGEEREREGKRDRREAEDTEKGKERKEAGINTTGGTAEETRLGDEMAETEMQWAEDAKG